MWRVGELATEGTRNLLANRARSVGIAASVGIVIGALIFAEHRIADDLSQFTQSIADRGGHVVVVTSPSPTLSAAACDRINSFTGVRAAGAVLDLGAAPLVTAGGALVSRANYSADAVSVIDPSYHNANRAGYIAGQSAAQRYGLPTGAVVAFRNEIPVIVVGMLSETPRIDQYSTAFLAASVFDNGQNCLIEMTPGNLETGRQIAAATFGDAQEISIRPLLPQSSFERNAVEELETRPVRWLWMVLGLIIALMLALQMFLRRGERAIYAAHGAGRIDITIIEAFETVPAILIGATLGILWATAVAAILGMDLFIPFALRLSVAAIGISIAAMSLASLLLHPRTALADQLKGR